MADAHGHIGVANNLLALLPAPRILRATGSALEGDLLSVFGGVHVAHAHGLARCLHTEAASAVAVLKDSECGAALTDVSICTAVGTEDMEDHLGL